MTHRFTSVPGRPTVGGGSPALRGPANLPVHDHPIDLEDC